MSTGATKIVATAGELIQLSKLVESKTNPRKTFDTQYIEDLAASIRVKGILVPLIVRPSGAVFEIAAGACRYRAAQLAKQESAPCLVRTLNDEEFLEIQLIENLHRKDLHPLDEAEGFKRVLASGNYPLVLLCERISKKESYIHRRLKLTELIDPLKKLFMQNKMTVGCALDIARLQPEQQKETVDWVKRGDSDNGLASEIQRHFFLDLGRAAFPTDMADLVPAAGPCTTCPKRTGANQSLFPDVKQSDICTDPKCFEGKQRAFVKIQVGTHPDAVLLSAGYLANEKPLGLSPDSWVKAGGQLCDDTVEGVLVEIGRSQWSKTKMDDGTKVGAVLKICKNYQKCKVHNPNRQQRSGGAGSVDPSVKRMRREAMIESETKKRVMALVLTRINLIKQDETDIIARSMWERLWHEHKRGFFAARGWIPQKAKGYNGKVYDPVFYAEYKKLNHADRARVVMQLALVQDATATELAVKLYKVNSKSIEKTVRKELAKKKK